MMASRSPEAISEISSCLNTLLQLTRQAFPAGRMFIPAECYQAKNKACERNAVWVPKKKLLVCSMFQSYCLAQTVFYTRIMHTWHTSYRNMRRTDTVFFSLWQLEILLFIRLLLWYVTNQPDYSYPLTKHVYYEMVRVWTNETILTSSFINCQQTFSIFTQTSSHVFHPRYLRLTGSSACVSSFW